MSHFLLNNLKMEILKGKFLKRINRFTCEVEVNRKREKAYLANSGRLRELLEEGEEVILLPKRNNLPYKLVGIKKKDIWVSTDAHLVNKFFEKEISRGKIKFLKGWRIIEREKKINGSRIDFILERGSKKAFCEIKSCTLVINGIATFPDAPTERGIKHINALMKKKKEGYESFLIFIVQRKDALDFAPNSLTHLEFSKILYRAISEGIKVYLIIAEFEPQKTYLKTILYKKLKILDILKSEYHLWRYPEVIIERLEKRGNYVYIEMIGTTCLSCSFEENFFDFMEFAKERGLNFKIEKIESWKERLRAKILWRS